MLQAHLRKSLFLVLFSFVILSCDNREGNLLESPSRALGSIVISSNDANHLGVTRYNLNGEFQEFLKHYRNDVNSYPRGMALRSSQSIIVALDGEDGLEELFFDGSSTTFYASAVLAGNIYALAMDEFGDYYVTESNRIEKIDVDGNRVNPVYIDTTVGACTLNNPRHLIVNSLGQLVVAQTGGGGRIQTYDISGDTASCLSSVAFSNSPYALLEHTNGNLYVATHGDDQIYEADLDGSNRVAIWTTDTSIINNPSALAEHPDGDLLVGAANNHTIEKIQVDGTRVGVRPYIKDVYTRSPHDILIIPEDNL